jgi:hypothetical protein
MSDHKGPRRTSASAQIFTIITQKTLYDLNLIGEGSFSLIITWAWCALKERERQRIDLAGLIVERMPNSASRRPAIIRVPNREGEFSRRRPGYHC